MKHAPEITSSQDKVWQILYFSRVMFVFFSHLQLDRGDANLNQSLKCLQGLHSKTTYSSDLHDFF
uniref:Uncharacterized protein n=1 Tax=Arundo donax TaxID=35708 RepID=A0A0A9AV97_ARUDO